MKIFGILDLRANHVLKILDKHPYKFQQAVLQGAGWLPLPLDTTQPYMISNHPPLLFLMMGHPGIPVPCGCHGNQLCC